LVTLLVAGSVQVMPAAAATALPRVESVTPAGQRLGYLRLAGTDTRFVPRGVNYVRLAEFELNGQPVSYHSTFEPGRYDPLEVERTLGALSHDGYNTVRVFIDPGNIDAAEEGHPHGLGRGLGDNSAIHAPYLDNVADFVDRAARARLYVQFSLDAFPQNNYYYELVGPTDRTQVDGHNLFYLHAGMQTAKAVYLSNFVDALRQRVGGDGLSAVLAYATDNEAFVVGDKAPFSRESGVVSTAAGRYDMADPAGRQQAQDANLVSYAIRMRDAVHAKDPGAMVTMGTFTYHAVGKPGPAGLPVRCDVDCRLDVDYRYPVRPHSLTHYAGLSFLDLHMYPDGRAGSLDRHLTSIEWHNVRGPVVLGEYGAFRHAYGEDVTRAAYAMRDLQVATCRLGLAGWLFWTWDTTETADQRRLFTLTDAGGAINGQLAPIVRGDPCLPTASTR
jgi:hypothetical protein